ncbi:MAG: hypothetical protein O3C21_18260 [Verrucomicrobia bacterium]|nr:hypothetical protein [Verrucomicrobiota bacterium]
MKAFVIAILISILTASLISSAAALFEQADLAKVPIGKLIANLEKQVEAKPDDAELLQHLARAHGMAFAKNLADDDKVEQVTEGKKLWFGYEPDFVPYAKQTKEGEAAAEVAKAHLASAIAAYERALKIKKDDATLLLGYGWCLEQSGKKAEAIKAYRSAVAGFWKNDKDLDGTFGPVGTVEAAGYLLPLLDAKKDAAEIADLNQKRAKIEGLPRAITPIAIGLSPGATLADVEAPGLTVDFDADGSGRRIPWNWISPDAAWLVYDNNGSGQIDSAIQFFGNRTFMLFFEDGYAAMRVLDADADGQLSGAELQGLALWQDQNSNGVSEAGEVNSLTDHGIKSLTANPQRHASGIPFAPEGVRFEDGRFAPSFDVLLQQRPQ